MNRPGILLTAVAVFAVAIANFVLGSNLIMPHAQAEERGAGVPWYLVWGMIYLTAFCAVALGAFLIASMLRSPSRR